MKKSQAPRSTYTKLPGRWQRTDPTGHGTGEVINLIGQNGFWAQHKVSKVTVFVVTTGQHKGIWKNIQA